MIQYMRFAFFLAPLLLAASLARADNWPQFRGATGDGISKESELPVEWSENSGISWVTKLPGRANSSPAVTSGRIDVTTQTQDNSLWVVSIARHTGKIIRQTKVSTGTLAATGPKNLYVHRHNAATPSPVADEQNIYTFFGTGLLVCVEAVTGNVIWQRDLVKEFGPYDITFGMGSSPRLWGERLYLACMTKGPSYVVALDKHTGHVIWKTDRDLLAQDDGPDAYSTPFVLNMKEREQLLISGSDHVNAYDLLTGKQLWISDGLTIDSPYGRVIASPVAGEDIVIATSGNPGGAGRGQVIAVPGTGTGKIPYSARLWTYAKTTPDSSTPVCVNGRVYMVTDNGVASCLELRKGKIAWQKRLSKGPYHASLVAGDSKVYFLGIDGNCTVIQSDGDNPKVLATNRLPGTFYATPAISNGTIYLRSYEQLYAINGINSN